LFFSSTRISQKHPIQEYIQRWLSVQLPLVVGAAHLNELRKGLFSPWPSRFFFLNFSDRDLKFCAVGRVFTYYIHNLEERVAWIKIFSIRRTREGLVQPLSNNARISEPFFFNLILQDA
jgi:hypothetical protein